MNNTSAVAPVESVSLTVDATLLLQKILGIEPFPTVLAMFPTMWDPDEQRRVDDALLQEMRDIGILLDPRTPHPAVSSWIGDLCNPDRQMTLRVQSGDQVLRVAVVRRGDSHVVAMRCDEQVTLSALSVTYGSDGTSELADVITQALGPGPVCARDIAAVTGPAKELAADHVDTLLRLGVPPADAAFWVDASDEEPIMSAEVEIFQPGGPRPHITGENVVHIIDTTVGRFMLAPRTTDYGRWATLSQVTPDRLRVALRDLIATTPNQSWV